MISRRRGELAKSICKLKYPAIVLDSQIFVLLPTNLLKEKTKSKTFDILSYCLLFLRDDSSSCRVLANALILIQGSAVLLCTFKML